MSAPLAPRPPRGLDELTPHARRLVGQAIIAHRRTLATVAARYPEATAAIEADSADLLTAWHLLTRELGATEVPVPAPPLPAPPTGCQNCGTGYRRCTELLSGRNQSCCRTCAVSVMHSQSLWEAACRANGLPNYTDALPEGTR